jgi:hypothetical protein
MIPLSLLPSTVWTVLVPLVDEVPDPEDVKPGWLGFAVFLLLAAALVVLFFSFRKQLRKVDFEEAPDGTPEESSTDAGERRPEDDRD